MKKLVDVKIFPILGMALAVQAVFAGDITDINVSTLPNNQKIVKVKFDKDTVLPSNSMVRQRLCLEARLGKMAITKMASVQLLSQLIC